MSNNVIDKIVAWNQKRGLDKRDFDLQKEASYLYSEILELTGNKTIDHDQKAYEFIGHLIKNSNQKLTDDEIADGFGDIIVFSIGALIKLGYEPNQVLEIINQANEAKSKTINELGKITKDANFKAPDISVARTYKK